jgi:DNA-binding YbaB/EbfC family protein
MGKGILPGGLNKGMIEQLQQMQADLVRAQEELKVETVEASAGGGAVRVVMTGTQVCQSITIDPGLLEDGDHEMLQDLIMLAVNQAIHDSQALAARKLGPLSQGLGGLGIGS